MAKAKFYGVLCGAKVGLTHANVAALLQMSFGVRQFPPEQLQKVFDTFWEIVGGC